MLLLKLILIAALIIVVLCVIAYVSANRAKRKAKKLHSKTKIVFFRETKEASEDADLRMHEWTEWPYVGAN